MAAADHSYLCSMGVWIDASMGGGYSELSADIFEWMLLAKFGLEAEVAPYSRFGRAVFSRSSGDGLVDDV